jgi:ABC-2 type transport system permease protein
MKRAAALYAEQLGRSWAIARKDIRIYYSKGPVVIFGILFPLFLFLSFAVGRSLTIDFLMPGLLGMILFFSATAISPAVAPWETQARTLERLISCPVTITTIILGDILASFLFGMVISLVPLVIGFFLGVRISHPFTFAAALVLAAFCFSSLGLTFSAAPASLPSTTMMISAMVKFPVVFISGVLIPLDELPSWGKGFAYISPLTYFTDVARHSIQNRGHLPMALDLLALVGFIALFLALATILHRKTMPERV